jgi:ubiquinone/menaquinone biosynthesis C-methylase UbiE
MMDKSQSRWMNLQGSKFFTDIGMKKNQFILDFGCGHGTYTIPAAMVVGKNGRVYAVDINSDALDAVIDEARKKELSHIVCIKAPSQLNHYIPPESMDMVLLYDVFHLIKDRKRLLSELAEVLKRNGVLSVFPKHHRTDMHMTLSEVTKEIESAGFILLVQLRQMLNFKRR